MKNLYNLPCSIAQALNIIGDKWTLLIIRQLMLGYDTYSSIQERLEGIPSNLLSNRLKALEQDGLITAKLYQSHPPRYRYLLTESGGTYLMSLTASYYGEKRTCKNVIRN